MSGETLPVTWWNEAVSEGLYGVHGHIFNPSDCDICDVYNAAIMAVGSENVNTSQAVLAIAMLQTRNIPQDAIP